MFSTLNHHKLVHRVAVRSSRLQARAVQALFALIGFGLAWCAAAATANAQLADVKPVSIGYEYYPESRVNLDEGSEADVSFQQFRAGVAVPIVLNGERTILLPSLKYQMLDVIVRGVSGPAGPSPEELHSLQLSMAVLQRFDDTWAIYAALGGGLASDLAGDLSGDDWVITAQLIGMWTIAPEFTLGAGVGYDRRTGDVAPLPLLAVNWQPSDQITLRGVVPQSLAFRYRPFRPMSFGIEGALDGERYHLSEDRYRQEESEIAFSMLKVGLSATAHWTESLHTRVIGGAALHRRFEVFVDDASEGDLVADTGPFVGVELWFGQSGFRGDAT